MRIGFRTSIEWNLDTSTTMNLTEYHSSYTINMYVSKCQYWNEKKYVWSSDGCEVKLFFIDFILSIYRDSIYIGWIIDNVEINGMSLYSFDHVRKWFLCSTEYNWLQNSVYEIQKITWKCRCVQYSNCYFRYIYYRSNLVEKKR